MADTPGEGKHERDESHDEDAPMTEARVDDPARLRVPPQVVQLVASAIPTLAERVTRRVQAEIPEYAGPAAGRRRKLIAMAVSESSTLFVRRLSGRTISTAGVDDLFRRMGYGEGNDGHDLSPLERALHIAGREAWRGLQQAVVTAGLSASTLGHLGDELTSFLDHLADQARTGHAMAVRLRERDVASNRDQLLDALLGGAAPAVVRPYAELAGWPVPAKAVLVAARSTAPVAWPDGDDLEGHTLARVEEDPDSLQATALYVSGADHADELVEQLRALGEGVSVAYSWSVPLPDVVHAQHWVTRALDLTAAGALPRQQVVDCSRYRTQLWLHAEPALRRQLAQDLLKPLIAETPNSREILSETLLVWLETRESAPAIAAILGVHPQTVRYRWRRINELFGEALHDAEFVVQLTMVLKASVPLWIAGDQSDFERYWSEEAP